MNLFRPSLVGLLAGSIHAGELGPGAPQPPAADAGAKAAVAATPAPAWRWTLGAGVTFRRIGGIRFDTGVSPDQIPNLYGADTFTPPPGIGPADAPADRSYDDGFVHIGAATPYSGLTTFWGYAAAAQHQGDELVFSRAGGERRDVSRLRTAAATDWSHDASWEAGPILELACSADLRPGVTAGFALNFSAVSLGGGRGGLATLSDYQQLDVYHVTAVDRYALDGVVPPAAGYAGSFAGPGPLLGNLPDGRAFPESLTSTDTALFLDRVRDDLTVDFYTLGMAGTLSWAATPRLALGVQAGVALNLADWEARREEVIWSSTNGGTPDVFSRRRVDREACEFVAGAYLQGQFAWALNDRWALQGFGRYDWNEDLDGEVGPTSFRADLSGWSVGAGARFAF